MRRQRQWLWELEKISLTAVAIYLISLWGTAILSLLIAWGPLQFLRTFGAGLVACTLVAFALAFPGILLTVVNWRESKSQSEGAGEDIPGRTQRLVGSLRSPHVPLHQHHAAEASAPPQPIGRDERQRMRVSLTQQFRSDLRFWLGVILVLAVESVGTYRLRPDTFPVLAMAVSFAIATSFLLFSVARYIYMRWWLQRRVGAIRE